MSLRVAIVGAGLMGRWHAAYAAREGAQIAAIVDVRSQAAAELGKQFPRAALFPTLTECLHHTAVDAVHVCTGSQSHVDLAGEALRAGKHVLVEKPVGRSTSEVRQLIELAQEKNRLLCGVHQLAFQRGFRRLTTEFARLGDVVRVEYRIHSAGGDGRDVAERRRILVEMLPHAVSLFSRLPVRLPQLSDWSVRQGTADDLELSANEHSTTWRVEFSLRARPTRHELTIVGSAGTATLDLFHDFIVWEQGQASRRTKIVRPFRRAAAEFSAAAGNLIGRAVRREPAYPGLRTLIREYYRAIHQRLPTPVCAEEMLHGLEWMEIVSLAQTDTERHDMTLVKKRKAG